MGCSVLLTPLGYEDGKNLIAKRLLQFRTDPAPDGLDPLCPFETSGLQWLFQETLVIRQVLNFCRLSLNRKLSRLVDSKKAVPLPILCPEESQIGIDDFKQVLRFVMSTGSWEGKP